MDSAVAVHLKGLGSSLCASRYSSIAVMSPGTELKLPRRSALSVSSRNQRSTRFSHDDEVGVKCRSNLVTAQPALHVGMVVGGVVVQDQVYRKVFGHFAIDRAEELQELLVPVPGQTLPITVPVSTSIAANNVVVPLRL